MKQHVWIGVFGLLLAVCLLNSSRTTGGQAFSPPHKDASLPIETRVEDLVSRMTLEEKVSQMMNAAPAIQRLEIPAYDWWNESLHGVARAGVATVFPQAIGLAATWDTDLMHRVADVISTEARAKYHEAIRSGDHGRYKGLTFWSPNINIFRDPRWGRGQETYGEDPYLTARMGVEFVKGLQGDDPKYFKVIATPKHYAVHSGPEPDRHRFDATTGQRDLYETYLPAFEACVREGGAYSVMCAYNRYMGEPCCAHNTLLNKILRDDWKFPGYVVSDCGAVYDIHKFHKVAEGPAAASAVAVKLGTDLECGNDYRSLIDAVKQRLVKEEEINVSLKRLFTARFRLGMFDPPEMVPYARIPIEENDSVEHRRLALQAARESIVLLKNQNGLLPLRKTLKKIAMIGPTADDLSVLLGNYNGTPSSFVTPLNGIRNKVVARGRVAYEQGCNLAEDGPIIRLVPSTALRAGAAPGLKAEYFANRNLEGAPLATRIDQTVDSNWINLRVRGLGDSNFSIRWTGRLTATVSGRHSFAVTGDDGYRLWINGSRVIDHWSTHGTETRRASIVLEAGRACDIKLEYFQASGDANVRFEWGVPDDAAGKAVRLARESEVVVFVGGISPQLEGEEMNVTTGGFRGGDRTSLDLPRVQEELLKAVAATGTPVVLVLTSGSALGVNWANDRVAAIVQLWYPGEEGGTAIADVLFGDYNPAGRLPVTFYESVAQLPPFEDYRMASRTYRYFAGEPLFPFGYGLSYTRFAYGKLEVPREVRSGENVAVRVAVTNAGKVAGDEVVQLYVKHIAASVPVAIRSLQGFKRVHLKPGQTVAVSFTITPRQLSLIDNQSRRVVEPGEFEIQTGGGQIGARVSSSQALTARLKVTGEVFLVK
ncbi:MAG TPA: glycoside hydrolase family 3 C-terminal domain-containing protein [Blastocatellia bacterium]|nr:glycoside hydrolase family 3 C-terminal domain-containing protein [Blastocatellia bacterium]